MQCPASHGSKTKPFAQITSLPSLFNGPGGAAIRANGLRDECANDYSPGVGSSPSQVDYSRSFPLSADSLPLSLPPLSNTPTHSLTPLLLHWPMFNWCFPTCHWPVWDSFPPNVLDQAVCHIAGRSLSTLWSKLFTASSTWWTVFPTWPHSFVLLLAVCNLTFGFVTPKLKCSAFGVTAHLYGLQQLVMKNTA